MIEMVCDLGSRYTKAAVARVGQAEPLVFMLPSNQVEDPRSMFRIAAAHLRPGLCEPRRLWISGDGHAPRRFSAKPLIAGTSMARAAARLGESALIAECGALRTRVYEVAGGELVRVIENERCTAGGGRFLETMAEALGIALDDIDARVRCSRNPRRVSNPCMVFAESEMISQVNDGAGRDDVLSGVVTHAASKVAALIERASPAGRPIMLCGGLSRFSSFRLALKAALPAARLVEPPADPLFFNCLAGLAMLRGLSAAQWPTPRVAILGRDS